MTLELNEQEHQYLLNLLLTQPVREALPMILKVTRQQLVSVADVPPQPPLSVVPAQH